MFRKKTSHTSKDGIEAPTPPKKTQPTVVASDINILGNLISDGVVDFDGKLDGNIKCRLLYVRTNAVVNGEITADEVFISGIVRGTVSARNVVLHTGGYVDGIVMHETITIEDGGTMDGNLKKTNKPSSPSFFAQEQAPEAMDELSPARLMENIRLIASNA